MIGFTYGGTMAQTFLDGHVIWWTGPGPLGMTLSSYAVRLDGVTLWIDAVDPRQDRDAVLKLGKPAHQLITFGDHDRDVNALAREFGSEVWVPDGQHPGFPQPDHVFQDGDTLPGGLQALAIPGVGYGETVLHGEIAGKRAGFLGDSILHIPAHGLKKWLLGFFLVSNEGPFQTKRDFRGGNNRLAMQNLPKILGLGLDAAFVSHGEPIVENAWEQLETSIASW
jgi:hypothetical protein